MSSYLPHNPMKSFLIKPRSAFLICITLVIASCEYPIPTPMQPDLVEIDMGFTVTEESAVAPTVTEEPAIVPTATEEPTVAPTAAEDLSPIKVRYRIPYFDCDKGYAVSAAIDLDISGGKAPYTTFPELPIFAAPGDPVSFFIESDTADGEPSGTIKFTVPSRASFDCKNRSSDSESEYHQATTDTTSDAPCPPKPNGKIPKKCDKKND